MEGKLILEIRTPDKEIFRGEISQVILPGTDGLFGILKDHAPMIATLQKGEVMVDAIHVENVAIESKDNMDASDNKQFKFELEGGVVEVLNNHVVVLVG